MMTCMMMHLPERKIFCISNRMMCVKLVVRKKEKIEVLLQDKTRLTTTVSELKEEVEHINSKLEGVTKFVCMLNSRT